MTRGVGEAVCVCMVWDECVGVVVGEGVVLTSDVWFVEECDGTVVGEGVVLICDVWLVGECGGTVVGEGVVLICVPVEECGGTVVGEGVVLIHGQMAFTSPPPSTIPTH